MPTIRYLHDKGARVVLLAHLGRPKGGPDPKYSLKPVARELERLLGFPVTFLADPTSGSCHRPGAAPAARRGGARGEHPVLSGEEKNDAALADRFAALGDLYVDDAFGSAHRAHSSTEAIAHRLKPAVAGFLMERRSCASWAKRSIVRRGRSWRSLVARRSPARSTSSRRSCRRSTGS